MASVALLAALVAGCDSFLDVNEDPNNPESARVDVRLPAVVTGVVHSAYYGDPSQWGVEWVQQTAYNRETRSYDEIQLYELQDNSGDGWWSFHYAGLLNETKLMMQESDPTTDAAYHGIAKFIWAWTWALTTDLWGPIPFNEAVDPAIPAPVYDPQPTVYAAVDQWFDEAASEMTNPAALRTPGANDLLFEGDMARWVKLLRHVQARHALRLSNAPWTNAQAQAQAALDALAGGLLSNADNMMFEYEGESGGRNPLWRFQDRGDIFKASVLTVETSKSRGDPRLGILVDPTLFSVRDNLPPEYVGLGKPPEVLPDSSISQVGVFFVDEGALLRVASYADAKLTEAEARLILSGAAAADGPYRAGIRADMERLGVSSGEIDAYLAARPPLTAVADPLAEILWEKYIANYLSIEPWDDWRRTGYPEITPVPNAFLPNIPIRARTPQSELATNRDNALATGISAGLDGMLWSSAESWWGHY